MVPALQMRNRRCTMPCVAMVRRGGDVDAMADVAFGYVSRGCGEGM
jgi:hypothetical protein